MEAWELLSTKSLVDLPCGCRHKVTMGVPPQDICTAVQDMHAMHGMDEDEIVQMFREGEFASHTCPARPVLPPLYQACIKCGDRTPDGVYCKACPQPTV